MKFLQNEQQTGSLFIRLTKEGSNKNLNRKKITSENNNWYGVMHEQIYHYVIIIAINPRNGFQTASIRHGNDTLV